MTSIEMATIAFKATVLLLLAIGTAFLLRRASAAARHLVLSTGLGAALVLPLLAIALPEWQLFARSLLPEVVSALGFTSLEIFSSGGSGSALFSTTLLVWLAGVMAMLAWIGIGEARLHWRVRRNSGALSPEWSEAIAQSAAGRIDVRFVECDWLDSPCTWGILRPVVLLPPHARGWTAAERRFAVIHELAHIERGDLVAHLVARLACAVYWYHPLAWLAARAAHLAREQACDDAVVTHDVSATDYAALLTTLGSRRGAASGALAATLGMAQRSAIGTRVCALLDTSRNRTPVSRGRVGLAVALGAALATGVATVAPAQPGTSGQAPAGRHAALMATVAKRACAEPRAGQGNVTYAVALRDSTRAPVRYTLTVNCSRVRSK